MKHYKFWVQILYLIFHFYFIICVQVELLTILPNGLLKEHTALEIKSTESQILRDGDICVQGHGDYIIHFRSEI